MAQSVKKILLNSGDSVPIIGFGTAQGQENIPEALNAALEAGYRHIDTAFLYRTETAIGDVLKKWFDSGKLKREDLFIVTKLPFNSNRADSVEKYIKLSLKALQLDYLDLYLFHHPVGLKGGEELLPHDKDGNIILDPTTDIISVWKALEAQVDAGRTKAIGLSNFNASQIKRIVKAARIPPTVLQVELNVYFQQKELVAFCKALDITVSAYSTLGSKTMKQMLKSRGVSGENFHEPLTDPVIEKIAKKHNKTSSQILIRHIIQRGIIALPASTNPDRIKKNIQVFDFELDENDMDEIFLLDKGRRARLYGKDLLKGYDKHPEYPYHDPY